MVVLGTIYLIFLFLVVMTGIVRFKRADLPFKILIIFLGVTFVQEIAIRMVGHLMHKNNSFLYHIISPIEFLVFTYIYYSYLTGNIRRLPLFLIPPVLLFALVNSFYIQSVGMFPSNFLLLIQLIYCVYGFLGLRQLLFKPSGLSLYKHSLFWLSMALVIFATTLFVYFGLLNYAIHHHGLSFFTMALNYSMNYVYYILIAIAIITETNNPG